MVRQKDFEFFESRDSQNGRLITADSTSENVLHLVEHEDFGEILMKSLAKTQTSD